MRGQAEVGNELAVSVAWIDHMVSIKVRDSFQSRRSQHFTEVLYPQRSLAVASGLPLVSALALWSMNT